jgi:hypothetical protein
MTGEQQRIAIAEACGWTDAEIITKGGKIMYGQTEVADYLNNLNAMHEAEKSLNNLSFYRSFLYLVVLGDPKNKSNEPAWATAAQRAEAFLRTIGKWTTNQPTKP